MGMCAGGICHAGGDALYGGVGSAGGDGAADAAGGARCAEMGGKRVSISGSWNREYDMDQDFVVG